MKGVDWLLMVLVLGWAAFLVFSLLMLRRTQRRIETTLRQSSGPERDRVSSSTREPRTEPVVAFDEKRELFRWEGPFENKKAIYTHSVEAGYTVLRLEADGDTLTVAYFSRDFDERDVFALLPYRVEVNTRGFYRSDLQHGETEALLRELLESYFDRGIKAGIERLALSEMEAVEALVFGYRTYRRFTEFLHRNYPDFVRQVQEYRGRPLFERLAVFDGGQKSREELLTEMRRAVSEEDYERAALIRDQLRALEMSDQRPTRPDPPSGTGDLPPTAP